MKIVEIDDDTRRFLAGLEKPVDFCDATGKVLGHYFPEPYYEEFLRMAGRDPDANDDSSRKQ